MPDLSKSQPGWYCFKALPKKEHIAAELLSRAEGLETLCPRVAYIKKTRRGKVRFVEPLFPGYLFVRADLQEFYRRIRSIQGVRDVVAFGDRVPQIPDALVEELKKRIGDTDILEVTAAVPQPGQEVTIAEGPFRDFKALVTGGLDSRQRVALLLEFLGQQMEVRMQVSDLIPEEEPKGRIWET